ncbi:MAG: C4-dicarboxylate TRAP transporter substrate-binding protein [Firmicutes bacterium]|nr:C4-dicarboxylate TRAP transporter substrate-binding protein [Bacillota bacterium]MBR6473576.1 C4-dicarboxylate TRAP transporter substrate-binding protein [Bacillota bacterium]
MKKLLAILLCIAVIFTFAACGGSNDEHAPADEPEETTEPAETTDVEYPEMTLTCAGLDKEDTAKAHDLRIFIDLVTEKSGGKITFNEYWSAQLGVATANLDTIGQGIADVGTVCTLYTPTQLPLSQITYCVPFAPSDVAQAAELMDRISAQHPEFYEEYEKNGTVCLAWKGNEPYKLYSKDGFETLDDINGKNITMGGVYYVPWFESIGAIPVSAPAADLYQTIKNNLAVGSFVYDSIYCDFKLYEVEANVLAIGLGARNCDVIAFNKAKWDTLDENTQALLQECATEAMDEFHVWEADQMAGWEQQMKDNGVTFKEMSEEDKAKWAETALAYQDTLQSWIDDATAAGYDGAAIMADYLKNGEEMGYTWVFDTSKYM